MKCNWSSQQKWIGKNLAKYSSLIYVLRALQVFSDPLSNTIYSCWECKGPIKDGCRDYCSAKCVDIAGARKNAYYGETK